MTTTGTEVEEYETPDPKRISELPTTAKSFAEVVAALRDGTVRHVFAPVPTSQRAYAAAGLRTAGLSFVEIADTLGLCTVSLPLQTEGDIEAAADEARRLVAEGLALLVREDDTARDELRSLAYQRIDTLIATVWGKATDPEHPQQIAASKLAGEHLDRFIKLGGLNAPAEHIIHTPDAARIAELVRDSMPAVDDDVFVTGEIEDAVVVDEHGDIL